MFPMEKLPFKLYHRFFFVAGGKGNCERNTKKQFHENEQKFLRQHAAIKFSQRA